MFSNKSKRVKAQLAAAESYEEWLKYARKQDEITGMGGWKDVEHSDLYDNVQIKSIGNLTITSIDCCFGCSNYWWKRSQ